MAAIVQYGYLLHMSRLGQYRAIRDKIIGKKTTAIRRSVDKNHANSIPGGDKEEVEPMAGSPPGIANVPDQVFVTLNSRLVYKN